MTTRVKRHIMQRKPPSKLKPLKWGKPPQRIGKKLQRGQGMTMHQECRRQLMQVGGSSAGPVGCCLPAARRTHLTLAAAVIHLRPSRRCACTRCQPSSSS